jgi:hypothetical protein
VPYRWRTPGKERTPRKRTKPAIIR